MASARAPNSGSKSFDFGSDDILCSHEDYGNQDGNNGIHTDPSIAPNPSKEFNKSRMARSAVFPASTYSTPEESSFSHDVISTVGNTMKKYTDNIMRFLEGISSRLSQLELYCYNLDKSIGEMHADWVRDHGEADSKLRSLEKHVQEVHRSVQILRDKQELADTQKELAKLQLAQKDSTSANTKQQNEERTSAPASEPKSAENSSDYHDQQLALALPHQVAPQPSHHARPVEPQHPSIAPQSSMPPQSMAQVQAYCLPPQQMNNIPPPQQSQTQYLPAQSQVQDLSRMAPQQSQPQGNMSPQVQSYPQQWSQQQPVQQSQQTAMPPQIRASSPMVYSPYPSGQPNQSPSEMAPGSMHMQVSFAGASRPGSAGSDGLPYGYGAPPARPIQQQVPTQQHKTGYTAQSGDGYMPGGPRPQLPPGNTYMVFDGESGKAHHLPPQPQFQQNVYPQNSIPPQNPPRVPSSNMLGPPQPMRGHPYSELIEKLSSMGYRSDHVLGVIQRLEESGQAIDFNAVLDRLNGHPSGSQRGW
ncbi:hypothetical protein SASPL_127951 [Salvia splendens]|uniref:DUF1421 domain-containing protein n=1 Tax=Salvia splendens TaxID=180675 RepID=A0A8X8XBT0_SALSN|nr:RNA polymerase II degradation factor 1-like [Salvia splendens]KAG6409909.1 hypothetical protein SASPL_127951 [Salvia splendens]